MNSDCGADQVCRLSLNPTTALFEGSCYTESGIDGAGKSLQAECRAYPEADSPFPSRLAVFAPLTDEKNPGQIIRKDQIFKAANIAQDGEVAECSYHKVYYASTPRYYGLVSIPPSEIKTNGNVQAYTRKDTFLGWEGYCLERDPSRPINGTQTEQACLTWYPVDVIQGTTDLNNTNLKSGYLAASNREYYCVESMVAEYRATNNFCRSCPAGYRSIKRSESSTCSGGYKHHICEPIAGEGWYAYDGIACGRQGLCETIGIMCSKLARIQSPDNRNRAWTTRILGQELPGSKEFFVKDLGWGFDQQNAPYGAARTNAPRLEDLNQALIVRDPNTFVEDCKKCTVEPGKPYGKCEDEEPDKKDTRPLSPNAGSPYALSSEADPAVSTMRLSRYARTINCPTKPRNRTLVRKIMKRALTLARTVRQIYGVWERYGVQSICVGSARAD